MRQWARAKTVRRCGSCNNTIRKGAVILEIRPADHVPMMIRCQSCGVDMFGEAAPRDIPEDEPVPVAAPTLFGGREPRSHGFVKVGSLRRGRSPLQLANAIRKELPTVPAVDTKRLASGED